MKKIFFSLGLLLVFITGSGCWSPNKTAVIDKAALVAEENKVLTKVDDAQDGFAGNSERIIFAGVLKSGPADLKVQWVKNKTKKTLKSEEKQADNQGNFRFEIQKPVTGWDDGQYTMVVLSNNQKIAEKSFSIQKSTKKANIYSKKDDKTDPNKSIKNAKSDTSASIQTQKNENTNKKDLLVPKSNPANVQNTNQAITTPDKAKSATFINGQMCDGFNKDGGCTNQVDYYYDNAKTFYASTEWKNLKNDDELWGVWYWEGFNGQGQYIADASVKISGDQSGFVNFSLNNNQAYWYDGSFWVEIYHNGSYITTIPFGVYQTDFQPTTNYPAAGYYDSMGNYILYNGLGYYDVYGNYWNFGTDWGSDESGYPEEGYYDDYGNYILYDGTGYYDMYGNFWFWQEIYGDGQYDSDGNYVLSDGSGYYDIYGNFWPTSDYTADNSDGYYDSDGNYIMNDGSGYYDIYGNFWSWNDTIYQGDGYYDTDGNYVLYDGSGYFDTNGDWHAYDEGQNNIISDDAIGEDGYFDAYGNYILFDGTGYFDGEGVFHDWLDYYGDYIDEWNHPNGDMEYWDDGDIYWDDYYFDNYDYYSEEAVG